MIRSDQSNPSLRITQAAITSLFALFDEHRWEKLPNEKELLSLPDVQAIITQHKLLIEGIRVKIVRQFKNWGGAIKAAGSESPAADESVSIFVRSRTGNITNIVRDALSEVLVGPFVRMMPWANILSSAPQAFEDRLSSRIEELLQIIVRCTSKSGRSSVMSVALETSINTSRVDFMDELESHPLFSQLARVATTDLGAKSVRLAVRIILDHLDRTLTKQLRLRFAPSAGMVLTIPIIPTVKTPNQLLRQTIYYVTGWVLSCLYDDSKCDIEIAPLLIIFIAKQTLTLHQARERDLPFELVASRTRGGLLYPSSDMFDLVLEIEHAFSSLLSMHNLIAFGGSLMTTALDAVMKSDAISFALHQCMIPVFEAAHRESLCNQPDPRLILERIVNKYIRMRGKDMVKSILSVLRLTKSAKTALSHRGNLAAATNAASNKHKKFRALSTGLSNIVEVAAAESDCVFAIVDDDEFDAMDEDLNDARFESDDIDLGTPTLDESYLDFFIETGG